MKSKRTIVLSTKSAKEQKHSELITTTGARIKTTNDGLQGEEEYTKTAMKRNFELSMNLSQRKTPIQTQYDKQLIVSPQCYLKRFLKDVKVMDPPSSSFNCIKTNSFTHSQFWYHLSNKAETFYLTSNFDGSMYSLSDGNHTILTVEYIKQWTIIKPPSRKYNVYIWNDEENQPEEGQSNLAELYSHPQFARKIMKLATSSPVYNEKSGRLQLILGKSSCGQIISSVNNSILVDESGHRIVQIAKIASGLYSINYKSILKVEYVYALLLSIFDFKIAVS